MKKFWRGFRTVEDVHSRQAAAKVKAEQLEKLGRIVREGRYEAEPEFVQAVKEWKPEISAEELQERIRQFRSAVSEAIKRGQEPR